MKRACLGFSLCAAACAILVGCSDTGSTEDSPEPTENSAPATPAKVETVAPPISEITGFDREIIDSFDHPWTIEFEPGTRRLFITHRNGNISVRMPDGKVGNVDGAPQVDRGGQDGLGDFIFAADYRSSKRVFLSWVETGSARRRGGVVGTAKLDCASLDNCRLIDLQKIWEQTPKTASFGHYSFRLTTSPDGEALFISSGDRRQTTLAQDNSNTLGTIVKISPSGEPAHDNPFTQNGAPANQIWSYGHRNVLGLAFDDEDRLWAVEHGPIGGDEFNLIALGQNYGWPLVSDGHHSNGDTIDTPDTRPDLTPAAISWTPVIAPSDMIIYAGKMFDNWEGDALITGLSSRAIVRVKIEGTNASEIARYPMGDRMRSITQGPDGAIWAIEEGKDAKLFRLTPAIQ